MSNAVRRSAKYIVYLLTAISILYGGDTVAYEQVVDTSQFDLAFWFRALLSGMLAILIYIARNSEKRLEKAEENLRKLDRLAVERGSTLTQHNGRILFVENEARQQAQSLALLEKLILTQYDDKNETEKHRGRVESQLHDIQAQLNRISRPAHRHSDDT